MSQVQGGQQRENWRASDADRELVASWLRQAMTEGRLSLDELDERLATVYAATTYADLDTVVTDLPASPFAAPGAQPGPPPRPTNTMAILSLVFSFAFFPLGTVFGLIARRQIRRTGEEGNGLALAGILVSLAHVLLFVAIGTFIAIMIITHPVPAP